MNDNSESDDYWRGYWKREREQEMAEVQKAEIKIKKLQLKPGDVVVISVPGPISLDAAKRLIKSFEENFPGIKAAVFGDGMDAEVKQCTNL